jgi:hypothetical protein
LSQYIVPTTVHILKRVIKSIACSTFSTRVHLEYYKIPIL